MPFQVHDSQDMSSRRAGSRPEAGREQEKLSPYCRRLSEATRKVMPLCQTPGHHITLHPTPRCPFRIDGIGGDWSRWSEDAIWGSHTRDTAVPGSHNYGCRAVTSVSVSWLLWQVAILFQDTVSCSLLTETWLGQSHSQNKPLTCLQFKF